MNDRCVNTSEQALHELASRLRRASGGRVEHASQVQVYSALEQAEPGYGWHGLRRGADPTHPFFLFQYTLAGWGCYTDSSGTTHMQPGMAFSAIIPSEHHYCLPQPSSGWHYFWLILFHPYIVQRLAAQLKEVGPVLTIEPTHPLIRCASALHENQQHMPLDPITREQMLFTFLWEYERLVAHRRPQAERTRLLTDVRHYVLDALTRPVDVAELARWRGMSRSNFSHFFRATTGFAPAAFVQQVRLEAALRLLLQSQQSIGQIAQTTGFASANHFCKVFRQRYHLSPGAFRRQVS